MKASHRHRLAIERPQCERIDLNLRSLDVFVQIADGGGMSSTARRLGLTQSAVSQMIANLEISLGVQVFDRQVRPIVLTAAGVVLLDKARGLLATAREAINSAREPAAAAFPKLNLCLASSLAGTIGPDLVRHIQGLAALWSVQNGLHSRHLRAFLSREADIALTADALEDEPNIERHKILKETFVVAVPKDFKGEAGSLAALAKDLDLVRFSARTLIGRQIERHLRRLRLDARGRLEFDSADAVLAMVAGGLGWAILTPLCALPGRAYWTDVRFVPMQEPALRRRLHVIARRGELGEIPKKIADAAILCLRKTLDEGLAGYPWMQAGCRIPEAGALSAKTAASRPEAPFIADVQPSSS